MARHPDAHCQGAVTHGHFHERNRPRRQTDYRDDKNRILGLAMKTIFQLRVDTSLAVGVCGRQREDRGASDSSLGFVVSPLFVSAKVSHSTESGSGGDLSKARPYPHSELS